MSINLINQDLMSGGIYRAILIKNNDKFNVYVPSVMTFINIINSDGSLNDSVYLKEQNSLPTPMFVSYDLQRLATDDPLPCFVSFESGDFKRPVVIGYFGKGLQQTSNLVKDLGLSTNSGDYISEDDVPIDISPITEKTVNVNWWKNGKSVTYHIATGGTGSVVIKAETSQFEGMYRTDWNKSCNQYKMQQKFISSYKNTSDLVMINTSLGKIPVVATYDFWNKGNSYVGSVIKVEFEDGNTCYMAIGDVKGNIANNSGIDRTVANLGHVFGEKISIIEWGLGIANKNTKYPTDKEIAKKINVNKINITKSITLTDTKLI